MSHIAVTGGTGFIGGHVLSALAEAGQTVRALTRRPSPRQLPGLTWISGDLDDDAALDRLLDGAGAIIHGAGAVKARSRDEFFAHNATAVTRLARLAASRAPGARFIHLSSLAAREPGLSDYTASKAAGEDALLAMPLPWTILRPPAVYGPGDREILKLFKALKYNLALMPGPGGNRASVIHGADVAAAAVLLATTQPPQTVGQIYELSDGAADGYSLTEIYAVAASLLGKNVKPKTLPAPLLTLAAQINRAMAPLWRQAPMLTPGKVAELRHPDWVARGPKLQTATSWRPRFDLASGLADTFDWYRRQGWL